MRSVSIALPPRRSRPLRAPLSPPLPAPLSTSPSPSRRLRTHPRRCLRTHPHPATASSPTPLSAAELRRTRRRCLRHTQLPNSRRPSSSHYPGVKRNEKSFVVRAFSEQLEALVVKSRAKVGVSKKAASPIASACCWQWRNAGWRSLQLRVRAQVLANVFDG